MTTSFRMSAVLLPLLASFGQAQEEALPRYRLETGQELTYRDTSEFKYGKGQNTGVLGNKTDWQVLVIRKNPDGSFRLVVRSSQSSWQTYGKGPKGDRPAHHTLGYFDLFADGRIVPNESLSFHLDPSALFPPLPKDAAAKSWEGRNERQDVRYLCTAARDTKATADTFVFDEVRESPMDKIYLSSAKARVFFDRKRGLVGKEEAENTQGYGFDGKGTGTLELVSVKPHEAAWLKQLAEETDRYFAANKSYEDLTRQAGKDAKEATALLDKAKAALTDARAKVSLPMLREQLDAQLKGHEEMAKYYLEEAQRRAEVVGKPAAAWETKDLDGKTHALSDYRGKVVILDFWYRGCGWCIRAMPQVNQLAEDFKNEPVVVFGMNTDRDEKDAKFVVEKMHLTYPVLKAEGLPEKYKVQGFPTLIIIDPKGTVADVHVGYSPTLREEVSKSVRSLLARK